MTLFAIWRELDATLTEIEREAITIRAIGALEWFPHVRWVRSFAIEQPGRFESLCIYEARSVEELRETSLRCAVPFVEIRAVEEELGSGREREGELVLVGGAVGAFELPGDWDLVRAYHDRERSRTWSVYLAPGGALPPPVPGIHLLERVSFVHPSDWAWVYECLHIPKHWEQEPTPA